jgi:hypothetical protein
MHSKDALPNETANAISQLQTRVQQLEKRIYQVTITTQPSSPVPPVEPVKKTPTKIDEQKHFMPNLRKAFASPSLPSFIRKAAIKRHTSSEPVVCTLPPYAKL